MAVGTSIVVDTFRRDVMAGDFDFSSTTSQTYKIALYTNSSDLDEDTATYGDSTATAEVASTGGTNYTTGGNTLTISTNPTVSSNVAYIDFADTSWSSATITARGALVYQSGGTTPAVFLLNFGGDKTCTSGTFTISFPDATSSPSTNAILRLA